MPILNMIYGATGGGGGWQPGTDTVAYYKFEDDYNDYSNNGYNVSSTGSTQLVNFNGVKCLDCNNSFASVNSIDTLTSYSNYTIMCYVYMRGAFSIFYNENGSWGGGGMNLGSSSYNEIRWGNATNRYTQINNPGNNQWLHVALVVLNGEGSIYINGTKTVLLSSGVVSPNHNGTPLRIGANQNGATQGDGYVSKLIIEKKGWTEQEISDYYNQTKSNYGL